MKRKLLMTPGPSPVPPLVRESQAREIIHHRTDEFKQILTSAHSGLKKIFCTQNPVLILSSSGTGAMEAAVSNFLSPHDKIITIEGGKFGERWSEIASSYNIDVISYKIEWGTAPDPVHIKELLDENKGVPELLRFYFRLLSEETIDLTLVLMGNSVIDIPEHPKIKFLGFLLDEDKFDALTGAEFLVIPSQFESLSMVTLEAWAVGKPVVANGRTEVLQGQCRRSNAGLWYTNYDEFKKIMLLLNENRELNEIMGRNGKIFFETHYSWPVLENKYLNIIEQMEKRRPIG